MTRRPPTAWDSKPHQAIFYSPFARLADRWAGAKDGRFGLPALPSGSNGTSNGSGNGTGNGNTPGPQNQTTTGTAVLAPKAAVIPYLDIRARHYLDRSELERRHCEHDNEGTAAQLETVREQITAAEATVADIKKRLEAMPETPDESVLKDRNAVEQHADEALVRKRRRREYDAARAPILAQLRQAEQSVRSLQVEAARLAEVIVARERIRDCRIRQIREHTLRRCGTYKRRLVHKHPDGAAVVPYLDLALPDLPDWLNQGD